MKKIVIIGDDDIAGLSITCKLSEKSYEVKVIEMDKFR